MWWELGCGRDSLSWTEQVPKNPGGPRQSLFRGAPRSSLQGTLP